MIKDFIISLFDSVSTYKISCFFTIRQSTSLKTFEASAIVHYINQIFTFSRSIVSWKEAAVHMMQTLAIPLVEVSHQASVPIIVCILYKLAIATLDQNNSCVFEPENHKQLFVKIGIGNFVEV